MRFAFLVVSLALAAVAHAARFSGEPEIQREPLSPEVQDARSAVRRGRFALPPLSLLDPSIAAPADSDPS